MGETGSQAGRHVDRHVNKQAVSRRAHRQENKLASRHDLVQCIQCNSGRGAAAAELAATLPPNTPLLRQN